MIFISQTPSDDNGNYTITWKDKSGNIVTTKLNLFSIQKNQYLENAQGYFDRPCVKILYAK